MKFYHKQLPIAQRSGQSNKQMGLDTKAIRSTHGFSAHGACRCDDTELMGQSLDSRVLPWRRDNAMSGLSCTRGWLMLECTL